MANQTIWEIDQQYVAHTYTRFPIAIVKGEGAHCADDAGHEYIDMTSGIGVNALGFADKGWADAVHRQLCTLQHTSNLYATGPCAELAKQLCTRTGMKKVFFANSGAETNEGAIKCARKWGHANHGPDCHTIVTLTQSFHGRTVTTLAATGQGAFHQHFHPFTEGFRYAPAGNLEGTLAQIDDNVCAVMIEMVQGEGGVVPLAKEYVQGIADACASKNILLIVDEVQTGIGRTGTLFAFEQFGITPDIVTCAKGLGGGLPIGAVLFGEKTETVLCPGEHATTFGGSPGVAAGALYVLSQIDEKFLQSVKEKGAYIREKLSAMPHVTGVSGLGLMIGATLSGATARAVVEKGIANGVLTLTAKDRLRLLPPLSITKEEIDEGLARLESALKEV